MMVVRGESRFRVALTADFFGADGDVQFKDVGLSVLQDKEGIDIVPMREFHQSVRPEQLRECKQQS